MAKHETIRSILFSDLGRAELKKLPPPEEWSGRTELTREVCRRFGFVDARGALRESSCLAVLRDLEKAGHMRLPPPGPGQGVTRRPQVLAEPVAAAVSVPDRVDAVRNLHLKLVEKTEDARVLATLLRDEHPQGAVQHGGRQMRYLIGSDHGWLGGFVFASPAAVLVPRDAWIGWTEEERDAGLYRVVGMSRFLVRSGVRCQNLASKALGLCLRRLGKDFFARYGIDPLLAETFTGQQYSGACLLAAGWVYVGESAGRGRRALPGRRVPKKAVYMRPLARGWRETLGVVGRGCVSPPRPATMLTPGEGLDSEHWAENEFGGAPLGGALVKRLVKSAGIQSMAPSRTFFSAASGDQAAVTGYYRMIKRSDESEFKPEAILAAHRERTLLRLRGQKMALLIQDRLDLNFTVQRGGARLGMHMHITFAVNADGIPLGVPCIGYDRSDGKADRDKPPVARKSASWLRGWRDGSELAAAAPGTRVISVMDREEDVAALFAECQAKGGVELLVRAKHDRVLVGGEELFAKLRDGPVRGEAEVCVDLATAQGRKGASERGVRHAQTVLRWDEIAISVPRRERLWIGAEPLRLTAVHVREEKAPSGAEAIEWLLLTNMPVVSQRDAESLLNLYALRRRIDDYRRILKTGCDIEKIAHSRAERIKRAVTINAVIAWRLDVLTMLGRASPELSARTLFTESEIAVLLDYADELDLWLPYHGEDGEDPELSGVSLGEAMLLVESLGGHPYWENDAAPGHQAVWEGYMRLAEAARAMERIANRGTKSALHKLNTEQENG